jgi:hypothetical protein
MQTSPKTRKWRTLLRVTCIKEDSVDFIVHGWVGWEAPVTVPLDKIPEHIKDKLVVGHRLHAKVNTGADCAEQLVFDSWEPT